MFKMTSNKFLHYSFLWLLASLPMTAAAQQVSDSDQTIVESGAFLNSHPDIHHRHLGVSHLEAGRLARAFTAFQRAAYYADKPSQSMVAAMYWEGRGVARDRALAYAWADLAAERHYPALLVQREEYWSQLEPSERDRAVAEGEAIYARYGDDVAQPRIERVLRRERMRGTGSRAGYAGNVKVVLPMQSAGGSAGGTPDSPTVSVAGGQFYDSKFWNPREYHRWTESLWKEAPSGRVEVGDLKQADPKGKAPEPVEQGSAGTPEE